MSAARAPRTPAPRSTKRSLASIVLGFELIIVFLAGLTLFGLDAIQPVPREWALYGGIALCVLTVLAMAMLRSPVGYWLGWFVQAALMSTGLFVPIMFIAGGLFVALWTYCMIIGEKLDRQTRAYIEAEDRLQAQAENGVA
ncbi:DUF4233 domain-containing protein [Lysinibacter cavernae]|uniref:Putative membrane protein n=1 Tax=Lysinibacter cavernae TaxID=1640652 RepID=A0A7X5QZM3_9MICO|nr:DUF4233 domain-containing protein [Lysinibacter cavernae]NIH52730.1 putative membrane protein [Lysinibacter cavernae]